MLLTQTLKQLNEYLAKNGALPSMQSAYGRCHSTETALLRVLSDIVNAADQQRVTLLALLDLSAEFDCVDHHILIQRLDSTVGLSGRVIDDRF